MAGSLLQACRCAVLPSARLAGLTGSVPSGEPAGEGGGSLLPPGLSCVSEGDDVTVMGMLTQAACQGRRLETSATP